MPLSASALAWNKKKKQRKWISEEAIVIAGGSGLVSQTKIAYGDFLKRQGGAQLEVLRYVCFSKRFFALFRKTTRRVKVMTFFLSLAKFIVQILFIMKVNLK